MRRIQLRAPDDSGLLAQSEGPGRMHVLWMGQSSRCQRVCLNTALMCEYYVVIGYYEVVPRDDKPVLWIVSILLDGLRHRLSAGLEVIAFVACLPSSVARNLGRA